MHKNHLMNLIEKSFNQMGRLLNSIRSRGAAFKGERKTKIVPNTGSDVQFCACCSYWMREMFGGRDNWESQ